MPSLPALLIFFYYVFTIVDWACRRERRAKYKQMRFDVFEEGWVQQNISWRIDVCFPRPLIPFFFWRWTKNVCSTHNSILRSRVFVYIATLLFESAASFAHCVCPLAFIHLHHWRNLRDFTLPIHLRDLPAQCWCVAKVCSGKCHWCVLNIIPCFSGVLGCSRFRNVDTRQKDET